jgi:hypothetical protein
MDKLRPGPITPIVFSMRPAAHVSELLSNRAVSFDLNGSGLRQRYQWVRPETALLVWDPERCGRITSGRQLFGSVTWWMFWDDGYQALSMLDDDRNGWVDGPELDGIAAWFDRDQDGQSDAGEVIPLGELDISALAAQPSGRDGVTLKNVNGLRLRDGRQFPTFDWVATPR